MILTHATARPLRPEERWMQYHIQTSTASRLCEAANRAPRFAKARSVVATGAFRRFFREQAERDPSALCNGVQTASYDFGRRRCSAGSCMPGDGSSWAVLTGPFACACTSHSAPLVPASVYGTTRAPLTPSPFGRPGPCERDELLLRCFGGDENGTSSSSTASREDERGRRALIVAGERSARARGSRRALAGPMSSISCSQSSSSLALDAVALVESSERRDASEFDGRTAKSPLCDCVSARRWFAVDCKEVENTSNTFCKGASCERAKATGMEGRPGADLRVGIV